MKFILNAFVTKSDLEYDNSEELWAGWQQGQWLQQLSKQISGVIMLQLPPMQSDGSPTENVLMRRGCLVLLSSQNNYGSHSRELQITRGPLNQQARFYGTGQWISHNPWSLTHHVHWHFLLNPACVFSIFTYEGALPLLCFLSGSPLLFLYFYSTSCWSNLVIYF